MFTLIKDSFRKLLFDADYAAARLRTFVAFLSASLTALIANGTLSQFVPAEYAPVVAAAGTVLAVSISQGERNKKGE